jgi:hypothetical protein
MALYQFYKLKPAICYFNLPNNIGKMYLIQYPDHLNVRYQLQNLVPGPYTLGLHEFGDERQGYLNLGSRHPVFDLGKIIVGPAGTYQVATNYAYPFTLDQIMGRSIVLRSGLDGRNLGYGIIGHCSMPI